MVQAVLDRVDGRDDGAAGGEGLASVPPVYGIGLVRVSGGKQAEEGLSLDTQPDDLRAYCRRARILLLKVYEEPAVRGWRERHERPEYAEALAHAQRLAREGRRVVFLVTYVDRLGRNHAEQSRALMELEQADVRVHTAVEFGGGPLDEDIGGLATWMAERNNRQQGMKVGGVWARDAGPGLGVRRAQAWGYDHRDRTDEEQAAGAPEKVRVPHAVEAPFARTALERLAAGETTAAVHRWVASLPADARGGRTLAYTTFLTIMQSPAYAGRPSAAEGRPRTSGRYAKKLWRREDAPPLPQTPEEVLALPPGRWEPLVSDETWLAAQHTLRAGRRPRGRPATNGRYLLTSLVRCPQCDSRMVGRPDYRSGTTRYVCTAVLRKTAAEGARPGRQGLPVLVQRAGARGGGAGRGRRDRPGARAGRPEGAGRRGGWLGGATATPARRRRRRCSSSGRRWPASGGMSRGSTSAWPVTWTCSSSGGSPRLRTTRPRRARRPSSTGSRPKSAGSWPIWPGSRGGPQGPVIGPVGERTPSSRRGRRSRRSSSRWQRTACGRCSSGRGRPDPGPRAAHGSPRSSRRSSPGARPTVSTEPRSAGLGSARRCTPPHPPSRRRRPETEGVRSGGRPAHLRGMGLRLTVELVCDVRRAPGCHGSYAVQGDALTSTVFEARKEAESAGWGKAEATGHLVRDDVCPACRAVAARAPGR